MLEPMDGSETDLVERWDRLVDACGWDPSAAVAVRDDLLDRYRQPHRHYHTVDHVRSVLVALDELSQPAKPSTAARLAVWFHDAVYEGVAGDDEEASAVLAERQLAALGTPAGVVAAVAAMVRATARHTQAASAVDHDTALVLDADLSILAAPEPDYDRYVEQVRREYSHVPSDRFTIGRQAVVAGLLGRERLFLSPGGEARFESAARRNLSRELHQLDQSGA